MTKEKTAMIASASSWGEACLDKLSQLGWSATLAADGVDALLSLALHRPSVFIIDCTLADIDIEKLCQKLAADPMHEAMTLLPVVDGRDSALSIRLQEAGLTVLDAGQDIAAAALGITPDARPSPSITKPSTIETDDEALSRSRPLILLVDDDRDLLRALKLRLRSFDLDVETSSGGRQAVFKAFDVKPDVIITDYSMPDGNAEYLLGQIREYPSLRETPVIVLTGWTFEGGTDTAHQRDMTGRFGAVAYLQKPVDFDRLITVLQDCCDLQAVSTAA